MSEGNARTAGPRRMATRRRLLTSTAVGGAGLLAAACRRSGDGGGEAAAPKTPVAPNVGAAVGTPTKAGGKATMIVAAPDLLDPHRLFQVPIRNIIYALYDGLVGFDDKLNVQPQLATRWEIVDGKDLILTLREGVTFHDGTDFNAEAVAFNFNRLLDPATKAPDAAVFPGLQVSAVSTSTVRFTNQAPNADFLLNLAEKPGQIISPAALDKYGNDIGINPVGSGPFQFVRWVQNDRVVLKKFPGHWDTGYPFLDELVFPDVRDGAVTAAGLRSGDFDIGAPDAIELEAFARDPGFQVWEIPGIGNVNDIIFFPQAPMFRDPRVRLATVLAIDRKALNDALYAGRHIPASGVIPPSSWAYNPGVQSTGWTFDPARAKALLKEAGVPDGFEFTNWITNTPTAVRVGETVQAMLAKVGIKEKLEAVESNARIQKQQAGGIDATDAGFSGRTSMDQFMTINYHSKGGFNYPRYGVPERDALIEKARSEFNQEARKRLYWDLEQLIVKDPAPRIPYLFQNNTYVVRKGIGMERPAYLPDNMIRFKWVYRS
jgi:peptide/nickel transport system substrate-binding protein